MFNLLPLALINFFLRYLPFFSVRRSLLRLLGWKIGKNTTIHRGLVLTGYKPIQIGNNCTINRNVFLDNRKKILIGDNVTIAHEVKIYTLGHAIHSGLFEAKGSEVVIEDNVVLFANCVILPGVILRNGCAIMNSAVVTKSIGERECWGGNPAKYIKSRRMISAAYKSTYPKYFGN